MAVGSSRQRVGWDGACGEPGLVGTRCLLFFAQDFRNKYHRLGWSEASVDLHGEFERLGGAPRHVQACARFEFANSVRE
jgi:hypothetical protein